MPDVERDKIYVPKTKSIFGEWERANLVVRTARFFYIFTSGKIGCRDGRSRVDEFSLVETKVCMSLVGIGRARDGSASDSDGVLLARQVVFHEFCRRITRFDPCHPYIDSLATNGLIPVSSYLVEIQSRHSLEDCHQTPSHSLSLCLWLQV